MLSVTFTPDQLFSVVPLPRCHFPKSFARLKASGIQTSSVGSTTDMASNPVEDDARELLILERQRTAALELERLHDVKSEKEKLALEVEREEELLTNNLQKKLNQLRKEKVDLENKLENEQEYIVNRLSKQLEAARAEKERLLQELQNEDNGVRKALESQVAKILHEKVHL
ncbi:Lipid binding protein, partial [Phytophthora palmivora]